MSDIPKEVIKRLSDIPLEHLILPTKEITSTLYFQPTEWGGIIIDLDSSPIGEAWLTHADFKKIKKEMVRVDK